MIMMRTIAMKATINKGDDKDFTMVMVIIIEENGNNARLGNEFKASVNMASYNANITNSTKQYQGINHFLG